MPFPAISYQLTAISYPCRIARYGLEVVSPQLQAPHLQNQSYNKLQKLSANSLHYFHGIKSTESQRRR
jgi:hypothetical protein